MDQQIDSNAVGHVTRFAGDSGDSLPVCLSIKFSDVDLAVRRPGSPVNSGGTVRGL